MLDVKNNPLRQFSSLLNHSYGYDKPVVNSKQTSGFVNLEK